MAGQSAWVCLLLAMVLSCVLLVLTPLYEHLRCEIVFVFAQMVHLLQYVFLLCAETGGILLSPRPAPDDSPLKPEFPARPFFGVEPVILDDKVTANGLFLLLSVFLVFLLTLYTRDPLSISEEMEDATIAAEKNPKISRQNVKICKLA